MTRNLAELMIPLPKRAETITEIEDEPTSLRILDVDDSTTGILILDPEAIQMLAALRAGAPISDDEITGVVSDEFFDEKQTVAHALDPDDLAEVEVLCISIKRVIRKQRNGNQRVHPLVKEARIACVRRLLQSAIE